MSIRIRDAVRRVGDGKPLRLNAAYFNAEAAGFVRGGAMTPLGRRAVAAWARFEGKPGGNIVEFPENPDMDEPRRFPLRRFFK